jgi:hypothetical protein
MSRVTGALVGRLPAPAKWRSSDLPPRRSAHHAVYQGPRHRARRPDAHPPVRTHPRAASRAGSRRAASPACNRPRLGRRHPGDEPHPLRRAGRASTSSPPRTVPTSRAVAVAVRRTPRLEPGRDLAGHVDDPGRIHDHRSRRLGRLPKLLAPTADRLQGVRDLEPEQHDQPRSRRPQSRNTGSSASEP